MPIVADRSERTGFPDTPRPSGQEQTKLARPDADILELTNFTFAKCIKCLDDHVLFRRLQYELSLRGYFYKKTQEIYCREKKFHSRGASYPRPKGRGFTARLIK